jgi:hypothetical protein
MDPGYIISIYSLILKYRYRCIDQINNAGQFYFKLEHKIFPDNLRHPSLLNIKISK